jgi:Secretion system C-terminal sorting domain
MLMRHFLIILFLFIINLKTYSQPKYDIKRDYVWIFGGGGLLNGNEVTKHTYFDFKYDTMTLSYRVGQADNFYQTNASICDTSGNFLFYSNGCVLADSTFQYIEGADTINKGLYWNSICGGYNHLTDGYIYVNGCWILPVAEKKFKILYADKFSSVFNTSGVRFSTVTQDNIDLKLIGYGVDRYLIQSDLSPEKRAIVRHANGRDWWFVNNSYAGNFFFISFIDSSENISVPKIQDFSELPLQKFTGGGQSVFSPDGKIYACFDQRNFCQIYNFDRCSGELSNLRLVHPLLSIDSIFGVTGIAISPNSQYLYLMTSYIITQYDLQSVNIESSATIVASNDGWAWVVNGVNYDPSFYQSQLGPDGKIYVFNAANRFTFAVIERPDSMGLACNVIQHKYFFPDGGAVRQPPRFPNFRLGAMVGSPCDTIVYTSVSSVSRPHASMKLLPNPASDYTVADISVSDYSENQQLILSVVDVSGREVKRKSVSAYTSLQRIETRDLKAGLYFVRLYVRGNVVAVNKLIVAHE